MQLHKIIIWICYPGKENYTARGESIGGKLEENAQPQNALALASDRAQLAVILSSTGTPGAATELYKMALACEEHELGEANGRSQPLLYSMTVFYVKGKQPNEAKQILPKLLLSCTRLLNSDRFSARTQLGKLVEVFAHSGDLVSAATAFEAMLQTTESASSSGYPHDYLLTNSLRTISSAMINAGHLAQAEEMQLLYVDACDRNLGMNAAVVARVRCDLARFYLETMKSQRRRRNWWGLLN